MLMGAIYTTRSYWIVNLKKHFALQSKTFFLSPLGLKKTRLALNFLHRISFPQGFSFLSLSLSLFFSLSIFSLFLSLSLSSLDRAIRSSLQDVERPVWKKKSNSLVIVEKLRALSARAVKHLFALFKAKLKSQITWVKVRAKYCSVQKCSCYVGTEWITWAMKFLELLCVCAFSWLSVVGIDMEIQCKKSFISMSVLRTSL